MSEVIRLYGTLEPPAISDSITIGQLSFTLEEGALRHIRVGSIEIIRCIAFLVRDRDWGCLLYTSPSPRDRTRSRMPSSA